MQEQAYTLSQEVLEYQQYIAQLENKLNAPMDEEYVAEIARDKLGLRHPQEVIFYSDDSD